MNKCKCKCGTEIASTRAFVPGHDLRAALKIISHHYGTIEAFVDEWNEVDAISADIMRSHRADA